MLANSTLSRNHAGFGFPDVGGGNIEVVAGAVTLENTILALNRADRPPPGFLNDCIGPITSLGNNLIGKLTVCSTRLCSPVTSPANPGLGDFAMMVRRGKGRFPLLATSPAIGAGNDTACPATDQLGTLRNGHCDIGAVEFYPVVNDLVALANITTAFDPLAGAGRPRGDLPNYRRVHQYE